MNSSFGEVFDALSKITNERVVIKKMRLVPNQKTVEKEYQLLKECKSIFLVRCYDVLKRDNELWVCCLCFE